MLINKQIWDMGLLFYTCGPHERIRSHSSADLRVYLPVFQLSTQPLDS
jgi:hypothetical protein